MKNSPNTSAPKSPKKLPSLLVMGIGVGAGILLIGCILIGYFSFFKTGQDPSSTAKPGNDQVAEDKNITPVVVLRMRPFDDEAGAHREYIATIVTDWLNAAGFSEVVLSPEVPKKKNSVTFDFAYQVRTKVSDGKVRGFQFDTSYHIWDNQTGVLLAFDAFSQYERSSGLFSYFIPQDVQPSEQEFANNGIAAYFPDFRKEQLEKTKFHLPKFRIDVSTSPFAVLPAENDSRFEFVREQRPLCENICRYEPNINHEYYWYKNIEERILAEIHDSMIDLVSLDFKADRTLTVRFESRSSGKKYLYGETGINVKGIFAVKDQSEEIVFTEDIQAETPSSFTRPPGLIAATGENWDSYFAPRNVPTRISSALNGVSDPKEMNGTFSINAKAPSYKYRGYHASSWFLDDHQAVVAGQDFQLQFVDLLSKKVVDSKTYAVSRAKLRFASMATSKDSTVVLLKGESGIAFDRLGIVRDKQAQPVIIAGKFDVVRSYSLSPNGRWFAGTFSEWNKENSKRNEKVIAWDLETGTRIFEAPHPHSPPNQYVNSAICVSNRGLLYCHSARNEIISWDATKGSKQTSRFVTKVSAEQLAVHDDKLLAIGQNNGQISLLNLERAGLKTHVLSGHTKNISALRFSTDGTFLASGSEDTTARIWETKSGDEVGYFVGHKHPVNQVSFSPNSRTVSSSDTDGMTHFWVRD